MTTDAGTKPLNIFQRLNEVRKAVAYVKKDTRVSGQYAAVTHDFVTASVRDHLIAHGIMIVPDLKESMVADSGTTTAKNIPIIRYEATYIVSFVNCDAPEERISMAIEAHALDQGDKAPGKALSYAVKYAMLKLFSIETGEDDEGRVTQKPTVTPKAGAMESLTPDMQQYVNDHANEVLTLLHDGKDGEAWDHLQEFDSTSVEAKTALWGMFDSTERTRLTKVKKQIDKELAKGKAPTKGEPFRTVDDAIKAINDKDFDLAADIASGLNERDKRFVESEIEAAVS